MADAIARGPFSDDGPSPTKRPAAGADDKHAEPVIELPGGCGVVAERGWDERFYERSMLNSPHRAPKPHHRLDRNRQPLEGEPGRDARPQDFDGLVETWLQVAPW